MSQLPLLDIALLHLLDSLDILWEISAACLLLGTAVVKLGFLWDKDTLTGASLILSDTVEVVSVSAEAGVCLLCSITRTLLGFPHRSLCATAQYK